MNTVGVLWSVIARFREICLTSVPDYIDPVGREDRDARLQIGWPRDMLSRLTSGPRGLTVPEAIVWVIRTPRTLKLVLRRIWEVWRKLHGEIDFDDLLVLNVLRFGAPPVFRFLRDHMVEIRALEMEEPERNISEDESSKKETQRSRVEEIWAEVVATEDFESMSARLLVEWLFPVLKDPSGTTKQVPQGLQSWDVTDYWERALREKLPEDEIQDQSVLRDLEALSNGVNVQPSADDTVVNRLNSSKRYASVFAYFAESLLDGAQIRAVASLLFQKMLRIHGPRCHGNKAPGFTLLWRVSIRRPVSLEAHDPWLAGELEKALQVSLQFANDLYDQWRAYRDDLLDRPRGGSIREKYISLARRAFESDAHHLLRILDGEFVYSSYQLAVLFSLEKEGGPGFVGEDWRWFADVLLEAGEIQPDVIIPQLARLLIDLERPDPRRDYVYLPKHDRLLGMFGHDLERLFQLLGTKIDVKKLAAEDRRFVEYAQSLSPEEFTANG